MRLFREIQVERTGHENQANRARDIQSHRVTARHLETTQPWDNEAERAYYDSLVRTPPPALKPSSTLYEPD